MLITSVGVDWQIQDVLNRCHNANPRADGYPPSPRIPCFADPDADVVGLAESASTKPVLQSWRPGGPDSDTQIALKNGAECPR